MTAPTPLNHPQDPAVPRAAPGAVRLGLATARGGRRRNEDALGVAGWVLSGDTPRTVELELPATDPVRVALADGMGGRPAGDRAAAIAAATLTDPPAGPPAAPDTLGERFARAADAVRAQATGPAAGMGCTAALIEVRSDWTVLVGNVGDVRVYLVSDGFAGELTVDDRPAGEPAPSGVVLACLGGLLPGPVQPHVRPAALARRDRLVLVTDGVHDVVSARAIAELATHAAGPVGRGAACLVTEALAAGARDNVTVAVIEITGPTGDRTGPATPPFGTG